MELTLPFWHLGLKNPRAKQQPIIVDGLLGHFIPRPSNNYYPRVFSQTAVAWLSFFLVFVKIAGIALVVAGPVLPAYSSAITSANIITLTNQARNSFYLPALALNQQLQTAAQKKAEDMLSRGYFSHNTPSGQTPWDFINSAGYVYLAAGENLAVNFTQAENLEDAWMNSPSHKANILSRSFQDIGIGIAQGQYRGHLATFVVQMFGTQIEQKVSWLEQPSIVQTSVVPAPETSALGNPLALVIQDIELLSAGGKLNVKAKAPLAVKVLAGFGPAAAMLEPKAGDYWQASIDLNKLTGQTLTLKVFDLGGQSQTRQLASFSGNVTDNYNWLPQVAGAKIQLLGRQIDIQNTSRSIYLIFITALLVSLVLAIAIHRHVQHLSLIANGSFVIILATLLWWAG